MPSTASPQNLIDQYLEELHSHLRRLPREQAVDIVEEIRSHILDLAGSSGGISEGSVNEVLSRLGKPSVLAGSYVADDLMERAQRSRMPWSVLRGVFHWATLSVKGLFVFIVCLVGYGVGGSFFLTALVKPINQKAGLWQIGTDSYSLVLGMTDHWPQGHELLGWKIIPMGLALGGGTILLTTYFARWCIRNFRQSRAHRKFRGIAR